MNEHDLLEAIGKTDEKLLEASEKRHIPWKFLLTAAACLLLVLSTAFSLISPASDPYTTIATNSNYQIVTDAKTLISDSIKNRSRNWSIMPITA
jgi:hypothetical protein